VGLWQRFTMIFKAKANRALDKAENPSETLDYSYQRQLEMLQKVKRGLTDVVTAKKRLQHQTQALEQSVVKLDGQARQAMAAGRDDLARTALERKMLVQEQLQGLDQQIAGLEAQQQQLVDQQQQLAQKVESFRTQKEVIKAQYSAAEAQVRIGEATAGLSSELSDIGAATARANDKVQQMQARAAAVEELVSTGALDEVGGSSTTSLDRQIAALAADTQVEAELARMRAELDAPAAPAAQLAEGQSAEAPAKQPEPEAEKQEGS
jgi:phage shock protein A